jgi:hypothetical protein
MKLVYVYKSKVPMPQKTNGVFSLYCNHCKFKESKSVAYVYMYIHRVRDFPVYIGLHMYTERDSKSLGIFRRLLGNNLEQSV